LEAGGVSAEAGSKRSRLTWYARRLASMSPPEIGHRVVERAKQFVDGRRRWSWDAFDFDGAIAPLPGLDAARAAAGLTPQIEQRARDVLAGKIEFLSATWPAPSARTWWRGDHWTLDPETGRHWPGRGAPASKSVYRHAEGYGDVKYVWELNRLQYLMPLATAARRDNDAALASEIADVIAGWMEANPPFEGVNWTNGIEAASRVVVALFVVTVLGDLAPDALRARLKPFLAAHVWMLARYPSLFSSANNHRVAELCALYLAYLCAPALPNATAARAHEKRELEREIGKQFHADGIGAEQSPTYAAYSLEWFLLAGLCGAAAGDPFTGGYREQLGRAARALRWFMDETGASPAIGDDDEGRVCALGPARGFLYPAAVCASTARWLSDAEAAPPQQKPTLLDSFIETHPLAPASPLGRRTFHQGGYTIWRKPSPKGPMLLAFDHAPLGFLSIAAHGHADALSLWLHIGGEPVIVDAGTYLYHTHGDARDRFRGTLAHNTLTIGGADQSKIAGPFNWSEHARTRLMIADETTAVAAHDGYSEAFGVEHERQVRVEDARIFITDTVTGTPSPETPWSAGWTLAPNLNAAPIENGAEAMLASGARVRIIVNAPGAIVRLIETEVSRAFGAKEPASRLVADGQIGGVGELATTTIDLMT